MENLMSYCGLMCSTCPAYIATINNDDELRKKTADEWSKSFSPDIKAEDINCKGCKSDTVFGYCSICEIRSCSRNNSYSSCAECSSFGCDKLESIHKYAQEARERLENLRR